jgi:hypothetical protein
MRTLPIVLLLAAACDPAYVERAAQVRFDPGSDAFWDLPFPSDLRPVERRFTSWPTDQDSELVAMWLRAADARVRGGWGLTSGMFVTTTAAIDPASLAGGVYLVDLAVGERLPLEVSFYEDGDEYAPANLIAATLLPGAIRRPATTYALVVTDAVVDTTGAPRGATRAFFDWWWSDAAADARAAVDDPARVVGAAVFTTLDPSIELKKVAAWTERQPTPVLTQPWTVIGEGESFVLHESRFDVPVVQNGRRPYGTLGEGLLQWDGDDLVVLGTQSVRVSLALPKEGAGPFPVTMYLHGSGGEYREGADRGPLPEEAPRSEEGEPPPLTGPAEWLAQRGIATLSYDFPLHGDRNDPPDTTGQLLYNLLGNIEATLDNYTVSTMELLLLSRLATTIEGLDGTKITAMGHSMGQTLGVRWATVDPRVQAFVSSGGGGGLVEVAMEATRPFPLAPALQTLIGMEHPLHLQHPLLHAFQNLWDLVDPVAAAPHLVLDPFPGTAPKSVFMGGGHRDGYFSPRAQAKLAGALGVRFVGDVVDDYLPDTLDALGRPRAEYPVKANVNGVTAVIDAYEGPFENGHFVLFDHEAAHAQVATFLLTGALPAP